MLVMILIVQKLIRAPQSSCFVSEGAEVLNTLPLLEIYCFDT